VLIREEKRNKNRFSLFQNSHLSAILGLGAQINLSDNQD
jgi:hypothetical protein